MTIGARTVLLVAACAVLGSAVAAPADPTNDVHAALARLARESSFHTTVTGRGMSFEVDTVRVRSDYRTHVRSAAMESIVADHRTYVKAGEVWQRLGSSSAIDPSAALRRFASPSELRRYRVSDLGPRVARGVALHAYRVVVHGEPHDSATVYLDGSGRVARVDSDATVATFSRYGENVTIRAPI